MSNRQQELAAQRTRLQLQAAAQREQLGAAMESFDSHIRGIDHGLHRIGSFVRQPLVLAAGAALLWYFGPRRMLGLVSKAAVFLPLARRLMAMFR